VWRDADLDVMEARLKAVLSSLSAPGSNSDDVQQRQQPSSPSSIALPNPVLLSSSGEEVRGSLGLSPCTSAEAPDASPERPMASGSGSGSGSGSATVSREGLEEGEEEQEQEEEEEEAVVRTGLPPASDSCATLPNGWRLLPGKGVCRPYPMGLFIDSE
jgi:hypothetical protein